VSGADRIWRTGVIVLAVTGCLLGLLTASAMGLIWTGVVTAVLAEATAFGARGSSETVLPRGLRAGRVGPLAALLMVGVVGWVGLLGATGILLVLVVALTCPGLVRPLLRRLEGEPGDQSGDRFGDRPGVQSGVQSTPVVLAPPPPSLEGVETTSATSEPSFGSLSTGELILAWRLSFTMLRRATTPQAIEQIACRRREYLDELERRDGVAVRKWLASGARAASDPTRYLTHHENSPRASSEPD
jgi:hypothetical protein